MPQVNMLEAKTNLSKLVEAVETGKEREIIIARNGKPVARIMPVAGSDVPRKRVGIADGEFPDFDYAGFQALDKVVWGELYEDVAPAPSPPSKRKVPAASTASRKRKS